MEKTEKLYKQLSAEERATIMLMTRDGKSVREVGRFLKRSPSTISRETDRDLGPESAYDATLAGEHASRLRIKRRQALKLVVGGALFGVVEEHLKKKWSPEQIAGTLKGMHPNQPSQRVSHETIYHTLYAMPRGELRRELIACLRWSRDKRRSKTRAPDGRGHIAEMQSIHLRPPEVADRLIPGHWEADLIKGAMNRSSVGTLVERTTLMVVLAKMPDGTAQSALDGFSEALSAIPRELRKTFTYDQGREMSKHAQLTERTGVAVYFCDPHSPWQRGLNENTNGLLRQYLPKGADLSVYTQEQLDEIAWSLNTRPRKSLGFRSPVEVYSELLLDMELAKTATKH
jgi:transposase, IS30 family